MTTAAFESANSEHLAFEELIQAIEEHPEIAWMLKSWTTSPCAASTMRLLSALNAGKAAIGKC